MCRLHAWSSQSSVSSAHAWPKSWQTLCTCIFVRSMFTYFISPTRKTLFDHWYKVLMQAPTSPFSKNQRWYHDELAAFHSESPSILGYFQYWTLGESKATFTSMNYKFRIQSSISLSAARNMNIKIKITATQAIKWQHLHQKLEHGSNDSRYVKSVKRNWCMGWQDRWKLEHWTNNQSCAKHLIPHVKCCKTNLHKPQPDFGKSRMRGWGHAQPSQLRVIWSMYRSPSVR